MDVLCQDVLVCNESGQFEFAIVDGSPGVGGGDKGGCHRQVERSAPHQWACAGHKPYTSHTGPAGINSTYSCWFIRNDLFDAGRTVVEVLSQRSKVSELLDYGTCNADAVAGFPLLQGGLES